MQDEKEKLMNGQEQMPPANDPEAKKRKDALDLWRSLKNVNANLPEDLIADELTGSSFAFFDHDLKLSPWINPEALRRKGAVIIWRGGKTPDYLERYPGALRLAPIRLERQVPA